MTIHYLNSKGETRVIKDVMYLQKDGDNCVTAVFKNEKVLTLMVSGIKGIADSAITSEEIKWISMLY